MHPRSTWYAWPTAAALVLALASPGCGPAGTERSSSDVPALRLASIFDAALVEGELPPPGEVLQIDWRFDRPYEPLPPEEEEEPSTEDGDAPPTDDGDDVEQPSEEEPTKGAPGPIVHGVEALHGVLDLAVIDGRLHGRATALPVVRFERRPDGDDALFGVEVKVRLIEGGSVGVGAIPNRDVDRADLRDDLVNFGFMGSTVDVEPSDEVQTCVVELQPRAANTGRVRHLFVKPTDDGKPFEIESVRLVSRDEHLATQAANVDWRGLGEVYRQTLLLHATETVHFDVALPARPWLDLAVGTLEAHPTTFFVEITPDGGESTRLLRRTVTTEDRWEETPLELAEWAGDQVRITFRVASEHPQQLGFFGGLVLHDRGAEPALDGDPLPDAPRGVIFVLADTLRRDHLDAYGYERETAPFLRSLVRDGALFEDDIAQASWTKVSVPSILSSLYPLTSGVKSMSDKLPDEATTLAENFHAAGYATFATSSVMFSGRATNLQQGIDVLHERGSVGDLGHSPSKTARTFVDRLTKWLEQHRDQPFFAFLHVFDPHSPFDPYSPYRGIWSEDGGLDAQEKDIKAVQEVVKDIQRGGDLLPDRDHFDQAGVDADAFVAREKDWYDESILAMDAELRRLHERLEELGLADDTLIVLTSDHGEEFLEHGRHFHGNSTYGEMTNVPLMMWGPRWIPGGTVVEETVQTLDVYPTLLELCGLPVPGRIQGRSLVPLLRDGEWRPRPAFAARFSEKKEITETKDIASFAVVSRGYRLVHNVKRPEGHPEYELYDHVKDPLNLNDLAAEMPDKVEVLAREIELWRKWAESEAFAREDGDATELTEEEREQLKQLGYVDGG